ncbi:MAG: hypothetical protein ACRCV0_04245, partial [Brevinema sp.]
ETNTNEVSEPLIASYNKGLDLMLVQHNFENWYGDMLDDLCGIYDNNYESPSSYRALYWDNNKNIYYGVKKFIETNYIKYNLSNIKPEKRLNNVASEKFTLQQVLEKQNWHSNNQYGIFSNNNINNEKSKATPAEFIYVGSLSELERVYLDIGNNIQYIKQLFVVSNLYFDDRDYTNSYELLDPVFPVVRDIDNESDYWPTYTYYTNKHGQQFEYSYSLFKLVLPKDN